MFTQEGLKMAKSTYEGYIPLARAKSKQIIQAWTRSSHPVGAQDHAVACHFLIVIFDFVPMYGLLMAFKAYDPFTGIKGIFTSQWNNFENFMFIFRHFEFWPMVKNTLGINLFGQLIGIPVTLMFALLLNEIRNPRFKSSIQTVTYLPHFLSWVIFGGSFITLLNPDGGIVNFLLLKLGLVDKPIQFLGDPDYFWGVAIGTSIVEGNQAGAPSCIWLPLQASISLYMRLPR